MGKDVNFKIPQPFAMSLAGGIDADLTLGGGDKDIGLNLGLDDIGVTLGGGDKHIGLNLGLNDIGITLGGGEKKIGLELGKVDAKIDAGLDNINAKIDAGLDNVNAKIDAGLDNINICFSFGIKEFPRMKVHLPTQYEVGFNFFGLNIFSFFLKGKSMLITEDNPISLFHHPIKENVQFDAVPLVKLSKTE